MQDCNNSIANALELLHSCTKAFISFILPIDGFSASLQDCGNSSVLAMELHWGKSNQNPISALSAGSYEGHNVSTFNLADALHESLIPGSYTTTNNNKQ